MAGQGKTVVFHGAFATRSAAVAKCRETRGAILVIKVRGHTRFAVITRRKT